MEVPDKIQLFGNEIKTVYKQELLDELKYLGQTDISFNEIRLKLKHEGRVIDEDSLFENYIHELLHVAIHKLGYEEIAGDETFIEGFSHLLIQIIKQLK